MHNPSWDILLQTECHSICVHE